MREKGVILYLMLSSLQHPIDKTGSTTSFSSEDSLPSVHLSARKLKLFINNDSKENEHNVDFTE